MKVVCLLRWLILFFDAGYQESPIRVMAPAQCPAATNRSNPEVPHLTEGSLALFSQLDVTKGPRSVLTNHVTIHAWFPSRLNPFRSLSITSLLLPGWTIQTNTQNNLTNDLFRLYSYGSSIWFASLNHDISSLLFSFLRFSSPFSPLILEIFLSLRWYTLLDVL